MPPGDVVAVSVGQLERERESIPPEELALARQQFTDEDIQLCIEELKNPDGLPLDAFLGELKRVVEEP